MCSIIWQKLRHALPGKRRVWNIWKKRYLHLGKVALYQMSYTRICRNHYSGIGSICQVFFAKGRNFLRYGSVGSSGSGAGLEG